MKQEWYYAAGGQKHGPISSAQLKELAASGRLQRTDPIWQEGMEKPVKAGTVRGIFLKPPPVPAVRNPSPTRIVQDKAPAATPSVQHRPKQGFLDRVRNFLPSSTYQAVATINSPDVSTGDIFKAIIAKLPRCKTNIKGDELVANDIDRSLKIGFVGRLGGVLFGDRWIRSIDARFIVISTEQTITLVANIHQGWSRWAARLLLGILLLAG